MHRVGLVRALVQRAVGPRHLSLAVHLAMLPLAGVGAAVCEAEGALSVHLVASELSLELDTCSAPVENSRAVLRAMLKLPLVPGPIRKDLGALARLLVANPLTLVTALANMNILAGAVCLAVGPLALVGVTGGRAEDTESVGLVVLKFAFVPLAVGVDEQALSVSAFAAPLALVTRAA